MNTRVVGVSVEIELCGEVTGERNEHRGYATEDVYGAQRHGDSGVEILGIGPAMSLWSA
jgi:hypothetical protein